MSSTLQYDVVDLALWNASKFEHQQWVLVRIKPVVKAVFGLPIRLAGVCAATLVNYLARDMAARAIWFRGARAEIEECKRVHELDSNDRLRAALDRMESELLEFRSAVLTLVKSRTNRQRAGSRVGPSLARLTSALAELYEEVRAFKGALQAHDADVCAQARGARSVSSTPEALDSVLSGLMNDK